MVKINIKDNEYPIWDGDHDSIINALKSITNIKIYNSLHKLEKHGFIQLSKRLSKVSELIHSVLLI